MPVFGTIASQFNDPGTNQLYKQIIDKIHEKTGSSLKSSFQITRQMSEKVFVIPPNRTRYLSEISEGNRTYDEWVSAQSGIAQKLFAINKTIEHLKTSAKEGASTSVDSLESQLKTEIQKLKLNLDPKNWKLIEEWPQKVEQYKGPVFKFKVRDKEIGIQTHSESLSHLQIPKVALPKYEAWGDLLKWTLQENVPGEFPYTAGIYPFKREGEDPTRMFAGEGGPERTNRRFHYVSLQLPPSACRRLLIQ